MATKSPEKKKIQEHFKHHMTKEVKITGGVIAGLLVLVLLINIPMFPYTAQEVHRIQVTEEKPVLEEGDPVQVRVCEDVPANVRVEPDPFSPFVKAYGKDYMCYAKIRVWNEGNQGGEWTYRYTFVLGTREIAKETTKYVPPISSIYYEFTDEACQEGDSLTGSYELVSGPTMEKCTYETQIPQITVIKEVTSYREEIHEVEKMESLWQKLIGANRAEKV